MPGSLRGADASVAQWVVDTARRAGLGSDTLPRRRRCTCRSVTSGQRLGVLAVLPANRRRVLLPEQRHLLETFAGQIGLALERARLGEAAEAARVAAESESLRNTLLASISHDLRTPLAVMAGAGSTLARQGTTLDEPTRATLARSIEDKAREMSELISNVLDLMRLESGAGAAAPRLGNPRRPRRNCAAAAWEIARARTSRASTFRRPAGRARGRRTDRPGVRQPVRQRRQVHAGRHARAGIGGRRRRVRARDGR